MRLSQEAIRRMIDSRGGNGGGGGSIDPSALAGLASMAWVEEGYISKAFFNELFIIHKKATTVVKDGDTVISTTVDTSGTFAPNEIPGTTSETDSETGYVTTVTTEVSSIESKKGFWTNYFLSALGLNSGGGLSLNEPLLSINNAGLSAPTAAQNGMTVVYNSTTEKWEYGTAGGGGGGGSVTSIGMTVPTGFSVSPETITSSGTFAITFANGYSLPLTADVNKGVTAYGWGNHAQAGYLTQIAADLRYLQLTGGTLTGALTVKGTDHQNLIVSSSAISSNVGWTGVQFNHVVNDSNVMYGGIRMDEQDGSFFRYNHSYTTYKIWDAGNDGSDSGLDADLLDGQHGSYYGKASDITTLQGYFTNGVANSAARLSGTGTYTAWGQTYWSSGVPQSISGNISNTGHITPSASGTKDIGGRDNWYSSVYTAYLCIPDGATGVGNDFNIRFWDYNNRRIVTMYAYEDGLTSSDIVIGHTNPAYGLFVDVANNRVGVGNGAPAYKLDVNGTINCTSIRIGGYTITAENGGLHINSAGLYADTYISALGLSSGGGGGASALSDLTDVSISSLIDGQGLVYDSTLGKWKNATLFTAMSYTNNTLSMTVSGVTKTVTIQAGGGGGTVTSVGLTVPTGFSVSPETITSSGTFAITFANGYSLPLTADVNKGVTAYGWGNHAQAGYLTQIAADLRYLQLTGGTLTGALTVKGTDHQNLIVSSSAISSNVGWTGVQFNHVVNDSNVMYGGIRMDEQDGSFFRYNHSYTTYKIWDAGNDGSDSGLDADLLDGQHGSFYGKASDVTTLQGYFTNGVANSAARLSGTGTYTAWGQTYWSSGVPQSISGNISNTGHITPSASGTKDIGGRDNWYSSVYTAYLCIPDGATGVGNDFNIRFWDYNNRRIVTMYAYEDGLTSSDIVIGYTNPAYGLFVDVANNRVGVGNGAPAYKLDVNGTINCTSIRIGGILITAQNNGIRVNSAGLYADTYVSALGLSDSGSSSVSALSDLTDVSISGLGNGQGLVYNSSSGKWQNSTLFTALSYSNNILSMTVSGVTKSVTIQAGSSGVTSVATGTGLTGGTITSTGTISINSTYQNYISHGESAYNSLSNYLPLAGGTMTGLLKVATGRGIDDASGHGLLVYHPNDWGGITSSQWGVGTVDSQGVIRSSAYDLLHYRGGTSYTILDTYNYTTWTKRKYRVQKTGLNVGWYQIATVNSYASLIFSLGGGWDHISCSMASFYITHHHATDYVTQIGTSYVGAISKVRIRRISNGNIGIDIYVNEDTTSLIVAEIISLDSRSTITMTEFTTSSEGSVVATANVESRTQGNLYGTNIHGKGYIDGFQSIELNSNGTLSGYGGFIDFHYDGTSNNYSSRFIETDYGLMKLMSKNSSGTNQRAAFVVGEGYTSSYIQIGDIRMVYDSNHNLRVVKADGTPASLYATGGISALGMSAGTSSIDSMTFGYLKVNNQLTFGNNYASIYMDDFFYINSSSTISINGVECDGNGNIYTNGNARANRFYLDSNRYLYVSSGTLYYYNGSTSKAVAFTN